MERAKNKFLGKKVTMKEENLFKRTLDWNESAGNFPPSLGQADIEALKTQCKFLSEEHIEVMDELDVLEVDPVKAAKELADVIFVAIDGIRRTGLDPEVVMSLLCDSNDSKFAANAKEIEEAEAFFAKQRVSVVTEESPSGLVVFRSAKDQEYGGRLLPKDKVLKAPHYFKAEPAIREYQQSLQAAS